MSEQVRTLRLGLADQLEQELREVSFEVTAGVPSVEVRLEYDRQAATVDLGCEGPHGWRGWSGGARERFVIAADAATPGYLPGPCEPGEWRVQLGLYRLPVEPIEITVRFIQPARASVPPQTEAAPRPAAPRASERLLPAPEGLTWFAGDFHAHSTHSDGEQSLSQLAALAVGNGLDFLAVTDHNTTSHFAHLPEVGARHGLTLIPGQEVTTRRGHANAFGDIPWVDFRQSPARWAQQVAAAGGILSVNHPLRENLSWQHPLPSTVPALELWHVSWFLEPTSTAPWALLSHWPRETILLGGSDYHHPRHGYHPGTPVTWVAAEDRSPEAILAGVRAGRTAITRVPTPGAPALVRIGDELHAIDAAGTVFRDREGRSRLLHGDRLALSDRGSGPYRLESTGGEILAISP